MVLRNMDELSAEDVQSDPSYDAPSNDALMAACNVVDVLGKFSV